MAKCALSMLGRARQVAQGNEWIIQAESEALCNEWLLARFNDRRYM